MKRELAWILTMALLTGPGLPVLAAEEPTPVKTETADAPKPGAPAPELPAAKEGEIPADVPEDVSRTAEPELPKVVAPVPEKLKPEEPESPYKFKNFALGFLGGAVLGGAVGVLFLSQGDKGFDPEKAKVMGPAVAGAGGLAFGLAAFFLGTTTPPEVKPPRVENDSRLPTAPEPALAQISLRYDWTF